MDVYHYTMDVYTHFQHTFMFKQLVKWILHPMTPLINSFLEETAYHLMNRQHLLIFNLFYTKQYFWIELFLEFTIKKKPFYKRSHWLFVTGGIQFTALLIRSYGIRKWRLSEIQRLKFNDIKAVMWLVITAHVIQVSCYAFSNSTVSNADPLISLVR